MVERLYVAILAQAICRKPQDRGSSSREPEVKVGKPQNTGFKSFPSDRERHFSFLRIECGGSVCFIR